MIKLGISSCFFYPDISRSVFGPKTLCYLENDMGRYLFQKNVLPVLIPQLEKEALNSLVEELDALVLQGGSDVCPESYAEDYIDEQRWPGDRTRDLYELDLVDRFYKKGKPIFGICRGAQILNVYFGGTLFQDINIEVDTHIEHRNAEKYDQVHHPIHIESGSLLEQIYPKQTSPQVNSVHHQAIKKLAPELILEASSADQVVEAFRHKNSQDQLILGVQWHPEFSPTLGPEVLDPQPLLDYFLSKVSV